MAEPTSCYLRVSVAGRVSVNGPIPFEELKRAYLAGKLGDHCELIDADGLSPTEAKRVTEWQSIGDVVMAAGSAADHRRPSETVEDLLRQMISVQERQVYWARMTAIVAFVAFLLTFVFGVTLRIK